MPDDRPIHVTRPFLPPLAELTPYLEEIWESRILSNAGPLHERFEGALCDHLGVDHASLVANGTLGLILALRALKITGEVITTPSSYVATSHALLWNQITPVFVDLDPDTLTIDPARIEAALTPRTTAILPVHCYGIPCDVGAIGGLAADHGLKVIYDAAPAFGVRLRGESILGHGDASVVSFHATKVFNTFEGGAVVCRDPATKQRVDELRNLGLAAGATVVSTGLNAKMSEFNAAVGLVQLRHVDALIDRRRELDRLYRRLLTGCRGIRCPALPAEVTANHAYFPILVEPDHALGRDALLERMARHRIHARSYFDPLISDHPMYRDLPSARPENLPVARRVSRSVICLPLSPDLADATVETIVGLIAGA
jgi:dTDP-4-amino-4,6-dideoxygalactose transaminase